VATKSTRKQIKNEARKMVYDLENAMMRLKRIDELAEGKSSVITTTLPSLVSTLDLTHGFLERFAEKL